MAHSEQDDRDEQGTAPVDEMPPSDPDVIDMGWRSSRVGQKAVTATMVLVAMAAGFVLGRLSAGPDVTVDGQVSYACALAERIRESHQDEDDWGDIGEDRAYSELGAIPSLLGLSVAQQDQDDFADVGWHDLRALRGDKSIAEVLDATLEECGRR